MRLKAFLATFSALLLFTLTASGDDFREPALYLTTNQMGSASDATLMSPVSKDEILQPGSYDVQMNVGLREEPTHIGMVRRVSMPNGSAILAEQPKSAPMVCDAKTNDVACKIPLGDGLSPEVLSKIDELVLFFEKPFRIADDLSFIPPRVELSFPSGIDPQTQEVNENKSVLARTQSDYLDLNMVESINPYKEPPQQKTTGYLVRRELGLPLDPLWQYDNAQGSFVFQRRFHHPIAAIDEDAIDLVFAPGIKVFSANIQLAFMDYPRPTKLVFWDEIPKTMRQEKTATTVRLHLGAWLKQNAPKAKAFLEEIIVFLPGSNEKHLYNQSLRRVDLKNNKGKIKGGQKEEVEDTMTASLDLPMRVETSSPTFFKVRIPMDEFFTTYPQLRYQKSPVKVSLWVAPNSPEYEVDDHLTQGVEHDLEQPIPTLLDVWSVRKKDGNYYPFWIRQQCDSSAYLSGYELLMENDSQNGETNRVYCQRSVFTAATQDWKEVAPWYKSNPGKVGNIEVKPFGKPTWVVNEPSRNRQLLFRFYNRDDRVVLHIAPDGIKTPGGHLTRFPWRVSDNLVVTQLLPEGGQWNAENGELFLPDGKELVLSISPKESPRNAPSGVVLGYWELLAPSSISKVEATPTQDSTLKDPLRYCWLAAEEQELCSNTISLDFLPMDQGVSLLGGQMALWKINKGFTLQARDFFTLETLSGDDLITATLNMEPKDGPPLPDIKIQPNKEMLLRVVDRQPIQNFALNLHFQQMARNNRVNIKGFKIRRWEWDLPGEILNRTVSEAYWKSFPIQPNPEALKAYEKTRPFITKPEWEKFGSSIEKTVVGKDEPSYLQQEIDYQLSMDNKVTLVTPVEMPAASILQGRLDYVWSNENKHTLMEGWLEGSLQTDRGPLRITPLLDRQEGSFSIDLARVMREGSATYLKEIRWSIHNPFSLIAPMYLSRFDLHILLLPDNRRHVGLLEHALANADLLHVGRQELHLDYSKVNLQRWNDMGWLNLGKVRVRPDGRLPFEWIDNPFFSVKTVLLRSQDRARVETSQAFDVDNDETFLATGKKSAVGMLGRWLLKVVLLGVGVPLLLVALWWGYKQSRKMTRAAFVAVAKIGLYVVSATMFYAGGLFMTAGRGENGLFSLGAISLALGWYAVGRVLQKSTTTGPVAINGEKLLYHMLRGFIAVNAVTAFLFLVGMSAVAEQLGEVGFYLFLVGLFVLWKYRAQKLPFVPQFMQEKG